MSLSELNTFGTCPDCHGYLFHPGPRGGAAWNVQCAVCGACYWYSPPFEAKRIDHVTGVYHARSVRLTDLPYPGRWK